MKTIQLNRSATWLVALAFALSAALAGALWGTFSGKSALERAAPTPPTVAAELPRGEAPRREPHRVQVLTTQGTVTHRGAADQQWRTVSPGDRLQVQETIKTEKDATVGLQVDEKSRIEMGKRTRLTIRQLDDQAHRFHLEEGKVHVRYEPSGDREVQIGVPGDGQMARTGQGQFFAQNNTGTLSVATLQGQTLLGDKVNLVQIPAGSLSAMPIGKSPLPVRPIPNSVMLRVDEPRSRVQREPFTIISGKTDVGAMVTVNDVLAKVDSQGRFWIRIPLMEGRNRILVRTEDVAANTSRKELPAIVVDSHAPIDQMKIRWRRNQDMP